MAPKDVIEAKAGQLKDMADKAPGRKTLGEFKDFLLRGNVVDLAVGVAVGAAFTAVVTALVANIFTPLVAVLLPGTDSFDQSVWNIPKIFGPDGETSAIKYGAFLNAVIAFLIVSAVIFFFVVKPVNHLLNARKTQEPVTELTKVCPECLSSIPLEAKRCAFCTSVQPEAKAKAVADAATDETTGQDVEESASDKAKKVLGKVKKKLKDD